MEWKNNNVLLLEGEMASPGSYVIGKNNEHVKLTPDFLKRVFGQFKDTVAFYLTHGDREPIGVITNLGYDESDDVVHYKGIVTNAEKARLAQEQGFNFVSPEFEVDDIIDDNGQQEFKTGTLTGVALTRQPAITTNGKSNSSWFSFSELPDESVSDINDSKTDNGSEVANEEIPKQEVQINVPVNEQDTTKINTNTIEIPIEIKTPIWKKDNNGGYILMDESNTETNTSATEQPIEQVEGVPKTEIDFNPGTNTPTPEQTAQIELAKRTLKEKQDKDAIELKNFREQIKALSEENEKLKTDNGLYKSEYDKVMEMKIKDVENELRGLGFTTPDEFMKDSDYGVRFNALTQAKTQLIRKSDATDPVSLNIEDKTDTKKSKIERAKEIGIPEEMLKYIKGE